MANIEGIVANFHETVSRYLDNFFPNRYLARQAREVLARIHELHPDMSNQISENMVKSWIKGSKNVREGGKVVTRSAQKRSHYLAFTEALNIPKEISEMSWDFGIRSLRVGKIQEGRIVTGILRHLLLDPAAANQHKIDQAQVQELTEMAKSCTYTLVMIESREKSSQ